jgi:hypothetical protein
MEKKYFLLGTIESNILIKIVRIIFGVVCLAVAIFWMIFNFKSFRTDGTLWITIIFLSGFGYYQIWAGLGRTTRFIEIGTDYIRLKKNPILPPIKMSAGEIEKIELFPFNVIFFLKTKKRIMLRFGSTYHETNQKIKDEILIFAELNKISPEIIREDL